MSTVLKKILVTGGTGYLGSHTVKLLLQEGCKVRTTVRNAKNEEKMKVLKAMEKFSELEVVEADLLDAESIDKAVEGCSHVLHVASPFPIGHKGPEDEIIKPALQGTKSVLEACKKHKVLGLVVTSSVVAIIADIEMRKDGEKVSEEDWATDNIKDAYRKSKWLAEKEVWEFYGKQDEKDRVEISTILPGYIQGPTLGGSGDASSFYVVKMMMEKGLPGVPNISFGMVDVRDVALAHYRALTTPEAAGKRHIVCEGTYMFKEIAIVLEKEFKSMGYKLPTRFTIPSFIVKLSSYFSQESANTIPFLDKQIFYDNTRMTKVLGISPISFEKTIIDMAYSLIENGIVKKTPQYQARKE